MAAKRTAVNKKASFDIAVEETMEAGLVLTGDEIKSIRAERMQLQGGYVRLMGKGKSLLPEAVVVGLHLSLAKVPDRTRRLLLRAKEIEHLQELLETKKKVAVPLKLYLKKGWAKMLVGIGVGRKKYDKRELLRSRVVAREQQRDLKRFSKT